MYYDNLVIDDLYQVQQFIGRGGTSRVFLANSQEGEVALKVIRKDKGFNRMSEQSLIINEVKMIQYLGRHPNILSTTGIHYNLWGTEYFQGRTWEISYMALEYCSNGSLYGFIRQNKTMDINVCKFYIFQLLHAVKHLHDRKVTHSDIKPSNIYLDEHFNLKLADLGWALKLPDERYLISKRVGTRSYMAPEVVDATQKKPYNPFKADMYSIGKTLYFLLTGQVQASNDTSLSTDDEGLKSIWTSRLKCWDENLTDFIEKLLNKDPKERISCEEAISHPWFYEGSWEESEDDEAIATSVSVLNPNIGMYVYEYMFSLRDNFTYST